MYGTHSHTTAALIGFILTWPLYYLAKWAAVHYYAHQIRGGTGAILFAAIFMVVYFVARVIVAIIQMRE
jgi:hypothetical protein